MAITAGAGIGPDAASTDLPLGNGAVAGAASAASVAATGSGLAFATGPACAACLTSGAMVRAVRPGFGAVDAGGVSAGPPASGRSTNVSGNGSLADGSAGCAAGARAGMSTTRRSGTSTRRSRQGKPKPGSPRSWSPKVRPNSSKCISRDRRNATVSRRRSARLRCRGRCRRPVAGGGRDGTGSSGSAGSARSALEPTVAKRAPRSRCRHSGWGAQGGLRALCDCRPDRRSGHGMANAPRTHSSTASCPLPCPCPSARGFDSQGSDESSAGAAIRSAQTAPTLRAYARKAEPGHRQSCGLAVPGEGPSPRLGAACKAKQHGRRDEQQNQQQVVLVPSAFGLHAAHRCQACGLADRAGSEPPACCKKAAYSGDCRSRRRALPWGIGNPVVQRAFSRR